VANASLLNSVQQKEYLKFLIATRVRALSGDDPVSKHLCWPKSRLG